MKQDNGQSDRFIPIWIWIIAVVQILLVLFFSIGTAMNPTEFVPDVSKLDYVTSLYITRNVTVAIGIIVALVLRSQRALLVILGVRLLTDIVDVIFVYALDVELIKSSVPAVVVVLILPALPAIAYLCKNLNRSR